MLVLLNLVLCFKLAYQKSIIISHSSHIDDDVFNNIKTSSNTKMHSSMQCGKKEEKP